MTQDRERIGQAVQELMQGELLRSMHWTERDLVELHVKNVLDMLRTKLVASMRERLERAQRQNEAKRGQATEAKD